MLVKRKSVQTTLLRILAGNGRAKKEVETKEWCRAGGCGLGFLCLERLACL